MRLKYVEKLLEGTQYVLNQLTEKSFDELIQELITISPPAIILQKDVFKNIDGFELSRNIKDIPELCKTKIFMITNSRVEVQQALDSRVNEVLNNPFGRKDLMELLRLTFNDKKHILLVDSNEASQKHNYQLLEQEGYDIVTTNSEEEAFDYFISNVVNLVITDVFLEDGNGLSLSKRIREFEKFKKVPIVIQTSQKSDQLVRKCFEIGIDEFLSKPTIDVELCTRVQHLANKFDNKKRERVLLVEKDEASIKMMTDILTTHGYIVDHIGNGGLAVMKLLEKKYSLVITEFDLPLLNGYRLSLAIRYEPKTQDLPIMMISHDETPSRIIDLKSSRIQCFLKKPFTPERFISEVDRILYTDQQFNELNNLKQYVSRDTLRSINKQEIIISNNEYAEDKFRTIMFIDIAGFSTLCEDKTSIDVTKLLNRYFEFMAKVILKYSGMIDKFIGDCIFCMFGREEDGAHRAVCAAMEMLDEMSKVKSEDKINIRVGINSGHVIIANLGAAGFRRDITAIGDNVNISQRLESNAETNSVLISESTYALIKDIVEVTFVGELELKGKTSKIKSYQVHKIEPYHDHEDHYDVQHNLHENED